MSKQVKWRRGTTEEHNTFVGAIGEVTVDTTKDTLVVHDGVTLGGHSLPEPRDWKGFTDELLEQAGRIPRSQPDTLGTSQRVNAIVIIAVARSLNVSSDSVIYATDALTLLDNVLYIYDAATQKTWAKPANVGVDEVIVSVGVGGLLTTNIGSYQMLAVKTENNTYFTDVLSMKSSTARVPTGSVIQVAGTKWVVDTTGSVLLASGLYATPLKTLAVEDFTSINEAILFCTEQHLNLSGEGTYTITSNIVIRQTAQLPPVREDFNTATFKFNRLISKVTGAMIEVSSPAVKIIANECKGTLPFSEIDQTVGIKITGQGSTNHSINWIHGFATNVLFSTAFACAIEVGFSHDSLRCVRFTGSNANVYRGRVGGSFSDAAIDPTSSEAGVDVGGDCSINEIYSNIEYCRRSVNSIGLLDAGYGTIYKGYIESNNALNISAIGTGGRYTVLNGGNNNSSASDYNISGLNNRLKLMNPQGLSEELADGVNSTLAFKINQAIYSSSSTSEVGGVGHSEKIGAGIKRNELRYSNDLRNAMWGASNIGGANWSNIVSTFGDYGDASIGYRYATRLTMPASASPTDIYRIAQPALSTTAGPVSMGAALRCVSGSVDIMIKLLEVSTGRQTTRVVKLKANSKLTEVSYSYDKSTPTSSDVQFELQFRTYEGAILDVFNTFLVSAPNVHRMPVTIGGLYTSVTPSVDAANGTRVLNGSDVQSVSPLITSPITLYDHPFSTYLVGGGWTGDITLTAGLDGQIIRFKHVGTASTSNILSTSGIDGVSVYPFGGAWQFVELQWSATTLQWVIIGELNKPA